MSPQQPPPINSLAMAPLGKYPVLNGKFWVTPYQALLVTLLGPYPTLIPS